MPTSRFRKETLLYSSEETEPRSRLRVQPGSADGAGSSPGSSCSGLLRKQKETEVLSANASIAYCTPKRAPAVTPKVAKAAISRQPRKEGEGRQEAVAQRSPWGTYGTSGNFLRSRYSMTSGSVWNSLLRTSHCISGETWGDTATSLEGPLLAGG